MTNFALTMKMYDIYIFRKNSMHTFYTKILILKYEKNL